MASNAVFVREMGDIAISIGTSFALQGLFNEHPDKKASKTLPAMLGDSLYINVRTLFRNMINAMDNDKIFNVDVGSYVKALKSELTEIKNYLDDKEEKHLNVYYYLPTYASLAKEFGSSAELREPSTELQKRKIELEKSVFGQIDKELKDLPAENKYINIIDMEIKTEKRERGILLTHLPVDLLYTKGFSNVVLLESHTGELKQENKWYTKFHAEASERIPFNKAMLIFFGDKGGMFKPQHHKARSALMSVADKYKWTYQTTKDKILLNLKLGGQGLIEQTVRAMFK